MEKNKSLIVDFGFINLFPNRKRVSKFNLKILGKTKMSEWQKIESTVFKFEKIGDVIEGVLRSVEDSASHENNKVYKIEQKDKKIYTVFGTVILNDLMQGVKIGQQVKILFSGTKESQKGQNPTKLYDLFVK